MEMKGIRRSSLVQEFINSLFTGIVRSLLHLSHIDYPGFSGGDSLEAISWDEFFEGFDDNKLAFLYQEETKEGKQSRFSKLIERDQ